MKQEAFEALYAPAWQEFEDWLGPTSKTRASAAAAGSATGLGAADVPQRYRRICQHLALARDRQYSSALVERLNGLVLRGHHLLYGTREDGGNWLLAFVFGGFPRQVRAESRLVWVAALLFFGPLLALMAALQQDPDFVHYLLSPQQIGRAHV